MSQLINKSHNTDDVLEKVDENYKTERIADELVVLEEICLDESELNMEYNTRAFEKFSIVFIVTESPRKDEIMCNQIRSAEVEEMNKKSVLYELERQKKLISF